MICENFHFLITTDNHLGVNEKNNLFMDSFDTLEEVLQIGKERKVDFCLQGGDLFDEQKPSVKTISQANKILNKYVFAAKLLNSNQDDEQNLQN